MKKTVLVFFSIALFSTTAFAKLEIAVQELLTSEDSRVLELEITNGFKQTVEGARGAIFMMDEAGKVHGRKTLWVVGGEEEEPSLAPGEKVTKKVVIEASNTDTKPSMIFTRIILEGGKQVNPAKGFNLRLKTTN